MDVSQSEMVSWTNPYETLETTWLTIVQIPIPKNFFHVEVCWRKKEYYKCDSFLLLMW
jgi:hypothetical protein